MPIKVNCTYCNKEFKVKPYRLKQNNIFCSSNCFYDFIRYDININIFESDKQFKFWFIGMMGADGSIKNDRHISISQSNKVGKDILEYIKKMLNFQGNITKSNNSNAINVTNTKIVSMLRVHGVVKNKTLVFKPTNIKKKYAKSFLRGYFEGDGSVGIYRNNKKIEYLCTSFVGTEEFISWSKEYLPIGYRLRHITRCKNLYEIRYNGKNAIRFLEWLYENDTLYKSYKYDIFKSYTGKDNRINKYRKSKKEAYDLYLNSNMNCMQIATELGCHFQLIYQWRKEWI